MTGRDRLARRCGFDRIAPLYERVRPSYPAALYDDLGALAGVGPGSRVLEIGCGTGQATEPLAERGAAVHAVELGPRLAEAARARLARFPDVTIEVGDFDAWAPGGRRFDVVFAATAFHWLNPDTRFDRVAAALRPGGVLATVSTHHVAGGTAAFFADVQDCYRRFDPDPAAEPMLAAADVPLDHDLGRAGRFGEPLFRRYSWTVEYATATYLDLLCTYSPTLALAPADRAGLLRCVGALIDGRYGGAVTKRYAAHLRMAELTG